MAFQTSGSGGARFAPMSEINVTPMVDVMLVLLVIFMVTAPMMMQGIDVDLAKADGKSIETDDKELTLSLTKDGRYLLGVEGQQNVIERADLVKKITTNPVLQAQKKIFLQIDKSLIWGTDVAPVMAILQNAGISNIGMITEPGHQDGK